MELTLEVLIMIGFLSFLTEYVDATVGMGYGTSLVAILLIMGFDPLHFVPALLISQFVAGLIAGLAHHFVRNVDFTIGSPDLKVASILSVCSIVGVVIAVFVAANLDPFYLKTYIGLLVLILGIVILVTIGRTFIFTWGRIIALGLVSAFNKGLSGGGFGPMATGGQILSGVETKSAIGITSLAEGIASIVGVIAWIFVGWKEVGFAIPLTLGALISVPLSAYTVKKIHARNLRAIVGIAILVLGAIILIQTAFG
ncbi:MAG: sulfite exporter TauE/SafE family protein [Thermoplasmata archaeon]